MELSHDPKDRRRVLVGTMRGMFEGDLPIGPELRTLDYLNRSTTRFVPLHAARSSSTNATLHSTFVNINIAAILWVAEVEAMPRTGRGPANLNLNRAPIRFCLPNCEVSGFLHTPPQGDPRVRLNLDRSPFLAVTSASIVGSDTERAESFVAVNAHQVFTVELLAFEDRIEDHSRLLEEAGS